VGERKGKMFVKAQNERKVQNSILHCGNLSALYRWHESLLESISPTFYEQPFNHFFSTKTVRTEILQKTFSYKKLLLVKLTASLKKVFCLLNRFLSIEKFPIECEEKKNQVSSRIFV